MKYLVDIKLDNNKIKKLSENIFNGLTNLKFLSLENNELETIENDTFIQLKSLKILNLNSMDLKG